MFRIYDGRDRFYQWDLERKVVVEDKNINQVHFCNRTDDCSLVSEVYDYEGLRVANVPNILLQEDWRIKVYAYDHNYTKHSEVYEVERRSKPADYIYTETEVFQYEQLVERMDNIDASIEESVNNYLTENPVEVDLSAYATTEYVDKAVEDVEVDLTGYATEQYVQDEIGKIDIPETDLTGYYTKTEVDKKFQDSTVNINNELVNNYYTKLQTNAAINAAKPDLSGYALKTEIPDTTGLATESYVQEEIGKIEHPTTDLSNYYTKTEVDTAIDNIDIPTTDLSNYYNKSEVDELIENIEVSGGGDVVSVEEVYVGTTQPTDENIKLWVNPDEEESFATTSYVDTKIADAIAAIVDGEEVSY